MDDKLDLNSRREGKGTYVGYSLVSLVLGPGCHVDFGILHEQVLQRDHDLLG